MGNNYCLWQHNGSGVVVAGNPFLANLAGLTDGTTYHFRAVAVGNHGNIGYGIDRIFVDYTPANPLKKDLAYALGRWEI